MVQGNIIALDLGSARPLEQQKISGEHWGTAMVVEVATCVCGVPPLPMGIGRVDRHEGAAGLQTWKGSKAA